MTSEIKLAVEGYIQVTNKNISKKQIWREKTEVRRQVLTVLQRISEHTGGIFNYYDIDDSQKPDELGLIFVEDLNIYDVDIELDETKQTIKSKKNPAKLRIRQNYKGDMEFTAISPYFNDKDNLKKTMEIIEPISPIEFTPQVLLGLLPKFIEFVIEWEK